MILELPSDFYVGHLIGRKGNTIRDIQELTGAKLNIQKNANIEPVKRSLLIGMYIEYVHLFTFQKWPLNI